MPEMIEVEREWLIFVDAITSLVASRRDLSPQTIEDLRRISEAARSIVADFDWSHKSH